jgi:hypothetical protein
MEFRGQRDFFFALGIFPAPRLLPAGDDGKTDVMMKRLGCEWVE